MSRAELSPLLARSDVWRGNTTAQPRTEATGHEGLDALLPGGGWPCGALTEILLPAPGHGELQLVLPWLARLTQAGGRAALVRPPLLPYAPALASHGVVLSRLLVVGAGCGTTTAAQGTHWALEQMLRSGGFSAVLGWPGPLDNRDLRRLQLAAEYGQACGFLYRDAACAQQHSPAALRLRLDGDPAHFRVEILKCRGGRPGRRWERAA